MTMSPLDIEPVHWQFLTKFKNRRLFQLLEALYFMLSVRIWSLHNNAYESLGRRLPIADITRMD